MTRLNLTPQFSLEEVLGIVGAVIRALTGLLVVLMAMSEWARTRRETFKYLGWGFALVVVQQTALMTAPSWSSPAAVATARLGVPVLLHLLEGSFLVLLSHAMAAHERTRSKELRRITARLFEVNVLLFLSVLVLWNLYARSNPGAQFSGYWGERLLSLWELFLLGVGIYLAAILKPEIRVLPALAFLTISKAATAVNLLLMGGGQMGLDLLGWSTSAVAAVLLLSAAHFGIVTETFTDPLTRLHNRRYFMNRVTEEFDRAVRRGAPISVLVMDLDHFKHYNDTQGHVAGDTLLRGMARVLNRHLRPYDVLCRWGGEEFIALLPETNSDTAALVAERLRQAVADIFGAPDRRAPITISIGVASWPELRGDWRQVVEAADQALYKAKNWRNRVAIYTEGPVEASHTQ